ncbi:polymorphic toxin type 35 domain-containing protein [Fretibacterium sp. OH1220_COT-178]|uniref:polymorphic toxin type 35 domain-containing protein n=1 Tax=Fretibacterium sp. OH1220_COT-178 TaxID=2491047 RepID=UPI00406C13AA
MKHISQDKHNWKQKLGFDPKDPKDWDKITATIATVLAVGTEKSYGSVWIKTVKVFIWTSQGFVREFIEVTYKVVDGILRISDAWERR